MNPFKKLFHLPSPKELGKSDRNSLPMRLFEDDENLYTWEDWTEEVKRDYPVKYFLSRSIPHWWRVHISMNIEQGAYWFASHTYRRQHMLDLRQPHTDTIDDYKWGYLDQCSAIVFANFGLLVSYYDAIHANDYKYSATPEGLRVIEDEIEKLENEDEKNMMRSMLEQRREVYELYEYWTIHRKVALKEQNRLLHDWHENLKTDGREKSYAKLDILREHEAEFAKTEEEMLIRLIKIRASLWV